MSFSRTVVCLAKSRKHGGYCIAVKTASRSGGSYWIRPTGSFPGGALEDREIYLDDGTSANPLDLLKIPLREKDNGIAFQTENYRTVPEIPWKKEGICPFEKLGELADHPETLWENGHSSGGGLNDFVPASMLRGTAQSIFLIRPLTLRLETEAPREPGCPLSVRAVFIYRGIGYKLKVTDIRFRNMERREIESLNVRGGFLTVSLGLPFMPEGRHGNGPECYKLAAAVLLPRIFRT